MNKCILKRDVLADGGIIRKGTVCDIEQTYPHKDNQRGSVDLIHKPTETLFWEYLDQVEMLP